MVDTSSAAVEAQTRAWFETWVIGLTLCPFAAGPHRDGRIRWQVSQARDLDRLLNDLRIELAMLADTEPAQVETTLLIHPHLLADFDEYNQFLNVADRTLANIGLEGVIQVASFHPAYRFADAPPDDPANATNRSPWPMLHLLREDSISSVVDAGADSEAICARNVRLLRSLSDHGSESSGPRA